MCPTRSSRFASPTPCLNPSRARGLRSRSSLSASAIRSIMVESLHRISKGIDARANRTNWGVWCRKGYYRKSSQSNPIYAHWSAIFWRWCLRLRTAPSAHYSSTEYTQCHWAPYSPRSTHNLPASTSEASSQHTYRAIDQNLDALAYQPRLDMVDQFLPKVRPGWGTMRDHYLLYLRTRATRYESLQTYIQ